MRNNPIPEKILNFRVYYNDYELLGIAEGNFPSGQFATAEIKGAGIAGSIDAPALGQLQSFTITLTWRSVTEIFFKILTPDAHSLDLYADLERYDPAKGKVVTSEFHVFLKARTKSYDFGKLATFDMMDTQTEFEVYYFKSWIDGVETMEVDKYNYIYKVNGVDYLEESRRHLGMI